MPLQTKTAAMAINNRLVYLMQLPTPLLKVTMVICSSDLPLPMHAHLYRQVWVSVCDDKATPRGPRRRL